MVWVGPWRRLGAEHLSDPGAALSDRYDLTMPCGRRIHNWLLKDAGMQAAG